MHAAMEGHAPAARRRHRVAALLAAFGAGVVLAACGANGEGAPAEPGCPVNNVTCTAAPANTPTPSASQGPDPCFTKPTPSPAPGGDAFCTSVVISTTTQDGLAYGDIKAGSGPQAKQGDKVTVQYTGWLKSTGAMFDTSRQSGRTPFQFTVGQGVITGWSEGVATMQVGAKRRFVIPPALAYGAQGRPPTIPANSTLVFDIELVSIP
jgi:FKBP-type peptidyl-prolyl cis-trans isomerase